MQAEQGGSSPDRPETTGSQGRESQQGFKLAPAGVPFSQLESSQPPKAGTGNILASVVGGGGLDSKSVGYIPNPDNPTNTERLKRKKERLRWEQRTTSRRGFLKGAAKAALAGAAGLTLGSQLIPQVREFEEDFFSSEYIPATSITDERIEKEFPHKLKTDTFEAYVDNPEIAVDDLYAVLDLENTKGIIGFPLDQATLQNNIIRYNGFYGEFLPPEVVKMIEEGKGVSDHFQITGLPEGTVIYSPAEGGVTLFQKAGKTEIVNGQEWTPAYTSASLLFTDQNGNHGAIIISVLGGESLIDIPDKPRGRHPLIEDGVQVKMYQPIMTLGTKDLINTDPDNYSVEGQEGQLIVTVFQDRAYRTDGGDISSLPLQVDFLKVGDRVALPNPTQNH